MKKLFYLSVLIITVSGCSEKLWTYNVQMTKPPQIRTLEYENDTFSIAFDLKPKWIEFTIYNKSEDGIKISWDEVSFSVNGKSYRIVHKETGLMRINDVQPPTTIPPKSNLEDYLVPANNVKVTYGLLFQNYITLVEDIFPVSDGGSKEKRKQILSLKGTKITVFFPIFIRGQYISKYYDLLITDIQQQGKKQLKETSIGPVKTHKK